MKGAVNAWLLLLVVLASTMWGPATLTAGAQVVPHEPIHIVGDDALDAFFSGQGTDGTSPGTAHVLEGLSIDATGTTAGIHLENTTRHLVIRGCSVTGSGSGLGNEAIKLEGCQNVSVVGCTLRGAGVGVAIVNCTRVSVLDSVIADSVRNGISVDRAVNVTIRGNDVQRSNRAMLAVRTDAIAITGNHVSTNRVCIEVGQSSRATISDNEVADSDDGIRLVGSESSAVLGNEVYDHAKDGLHLDSSSGNLVHLNRVEATKDGIHLYSSDRNVLTDNTAIDCYRGLYLSNSDENLASGNELTKNRVGGIRLWGSNDNMFVENRVTLNEDYGLRLEASDRNSFEDNIIRGNLLSGIEDDGADNTFSGNDIRFNGWMRFLLLRLIPGIAITLVAIGVLVWAVRRRRWRSERERIVVRTLAASDGKGLWALSKVVNDEIFFQAQYQSAGPQKEKILERYKDNISGAKQMQHLSTGIMSAMLVFIAFLPLGGLFRVIDMDVTHENVNDMLFAISISIVLYYVMSFVMLLIFGLLFMANLVKGDSFILLSTLPLDKRSVRRVIGYVMLRMYAAPLGVIFLAYPVGGYIITGSAGFLATALFSNAVNLVLIVYLIVAVSEALSTKIFTASTSRWSTVLRVVVMTSYLMAMMFIIIALQFLLGYISELYLAERLSGGSGEALNSALALVPFAFASSYLNSFALVPGEILPLPVLLASAMGMVAQVGLAYYLYRRGNRTISRMAIGAVATSRGGEQAATAADIEVRTSGTIAAFMRNSLKVSTRDVGSIIYVIMPIIFPLFMLIGNPYFDTSFDALMGTIFYLGMMPVLLYLGLSTADETVGGLLSSMPFRIRDLYRAKQVLMVSIMACPLLITLGLTWWRTPDPVELLLFAGSIVPLNVILASAFLMGYSTLFGKVNQRHTFFAVNTESKMAKYIGLGAGMYGIMIGDLLLFGLIWDRLGFMVGVVALLAFNLVLIAALEWVARRLF